MSTVDERRRGRLKPDDVVKLFKEVYIPGVEELVERIGRRYRRLRVRRRGAAGRKELELKRVELVYNILRDTFRRLASLPSTSEMDEFHATLIREMMGGAYDAAIERARYILRMLERIWDDYRLLIVTAPNVREASRLRKEATGRMISFWRRYRRHLETLLRAKEEIVKTHVVSEDLPVVVVAGVPSAGKSTLIRRVSTAEPEVAPYPFTTRSIIVGKFRCGRLDAYIVDTPGILDRPLEELNEIERKAYVALKSLAHTVIYLFDPSVERSVDLEGQARVLQEIMREFAPGRPLLVAVNKVDIAGEEAILEAERLARKAGYTGRVYRVSAATGEGVDELLRDACRAALDYYLRRAATLPPQSSG